MCGFVVLVQPSEKADPCLVASMAALLKHSGPDDERVYAHDGVAMHHKRLAFIELEGGFSKAVLRHAASYLLPDQILNRTDKMGFPVPLQRWTRGPARELVRDILLSQRARQGGIFSAEQSEKLIGNEFDFGRSLWAHCRSRCGTGLSSIRTCRRFTRTRRIYLNPDSR